MMKRGGDPSSSYLLVEKEKGGLFNTGGEKKDRERGGKNIHRPL